MQASKPESCQASFDFLTTCPGLNEDNAAEVFSAASNPEKTRPILGARHSIQTFDPDRSHDSIVKLAALRQRDGSNSSAAVSAHLDSISFEPLRCIKNAAPPKRFYRTFWRSLARRVVEKSETDSMRSTR